MSDLDAVAEAICNALYDDPEMWSLLSTPRKNPYRRAARCMLDALRPTVSTVEQLDALPVGTLVVTEDGRAFRRRFQSAGWEWQEFSGFDHDAKDVPLPVAVAWRPEAVDR
jgi:hypothetical protein